MVIPFDQAAPEAERFPRRLAVSFTEHIDTLDGPLLTRVQMWRGEAALGDALDDNSADPDAYRYHDIFHLAFMAVLTWSPVMRYLLNVRRNYDPLIRRNEDGGRAIAIEEGVTAYLFAMARRHGYFRSLAEIPIEVVDTCRDMTSHLEVSDRSGRDWRAAIHAGYEVFRDVSAAGGGRVMADLDDQTLTCEVS